MLFSIHGVHICFFVRAPKTRKKQNLNEASLHCRLKKAGEFRIFRSIRQFCHRLGRHYWSNDEVCRQNAKCFKKKRYNDFTKIYPNSKIDFKPKQGGTRSGIVVTVTCNDEETNYNMKTYHHAGSSVSLQNTSKRHLPDLCEMFAYRLLELIGVGPLVFFPFYAGSTYIHYIATKEVSEFKELDKLEDVSVQNKVVVEAYLLLLILGIRDLNEGNIGLNKEKSLSIVDFSGCRQLSTMQNT